MYVNWMRVIFGLLPLVGDEINMRAALKEFKIQVREIDP